MVLRKFVIAGLLCSSLMVANPCAAAQGQRNDSPAALKARISRLENENQMLGKALAQATKRHHEALRGEKTVQNDAPKACDVSEDAPVLYNKIEEMKAQNESLRDTIRAQNDALLAADNTSQLIHSLRQENAALKNGKSGRMNGADESAESVNVTGLKETIKALRQDNERLLSQIGGGSSDADEQKAAQIQMENQELKARIALLEESGGVAEKQQIIAKKDKKKSKEAELDIATIELLQAEAAQQNVAFMRGEKQVISGHSVEELEVPTKKVAEVTKSSKNKQGAYALKSKKKVSTGIKKQRVPDGIKVTKGDALPDISPAAGQSSEDLLALDPLPLSKKK